MQLHLVSFDIPFPADYGGVIDVFYKIKALAKQGVQIHLHCFQYGGRQPSTELAKWCKTVHYYPRKMGIRSQVSWLPYIVQSRKSELLLQRLIDQPYPILFEGLHCCIYLNHPALRDRIKLLRMHNLEWAYYQSLAEMTDSWWKKLFFQVESWRLKKFEKEIDTQNTTILAISPTEYQYFQRENFQVQHIPPFHQHTTIQSRVGEGKYAIFPANLSVADNELSALFLIEKVFAKLDFRLIIAGKNPSQKLIQTVKEYEHITLVINPLGAKMQELIANAHCAVLWTFQDAGTKLKLLDSLYTARHVIVNDLMVNDARLAACCTVVNNANELRNTILQLQKIPFNATILEQRRKKLAPFLPATNAKAVILPLQKMEK